MPCLSSKKTAVLIGFVVGGIVLLTSILVVVSYLSLSAFVPEDAFSKNLAEPGALVETSRSYEHVNSSLGQDGHSIPSPGPSTSSIPDYHVTTAGSPLLLPSKQESEPMVELHLPEDSGANSVEGGLDGVPDYMKGPPSLAEPDSVASLIELPDLGGFTSSSPYMSAGERCQAWYECQEPFLKRYRKYFELLPSCPCHYPKGLYFEGTTWDEKTGSHVVWHASGITPIQMRVYHSGAEKCIQTEAPPAASARGFVGSQTCCFDRKDRLITRGSGAGRPYLVSSQVSPALHHIVDLVPWMLCRGDWSKYNKIHPPNNDLGCKRIPGRVRFLHQAWELRKESLRLQGQEPEDED